MDDPLATGQYYRDKATKKGDIVMSGYPHLRDALFQG